MRSLFPDGLGGSLARYKDLTLSARNADMAPEEALAAKHGFVTYDPTVCGWYLLALEETAAACRAPRAGGRGGGAGGHGHGGGTGDREPCSGGTRGASSSPTMSPEVVNSRGMGAMGLLPAASRALAATGLSERVAQRHLQRAGPMWGPCGFAAGTISPGGGVGSYVQWDGNAVWGATAYWAYLLAARIGRWVDARRLRDQLTGLIDATDSGSSTTRKPANPAAWRENRGSRGPPWPWT